MSPRRRKEELAVPREKACLLRDQIGQSVKREEPNLFDLRAKPQCPARHATQEPDVEAARASTRAELEGALRLRDKPGLFVDLSHDGLRGRFVRTDMPTRKAPWGERSIGVTEEQHPTIGVDDHADYPNEEARFAETHAEALRAGRELAPDPQRKAPHTVAAALPSATFS